MKGAVISLGAQSSKWVVEEMKKYFDEVSHINLKKIEVILGDKEPEILYEDKPLEHFDCVYVRGSFRYAELLFSISSILANKKDVYVPLAPISLLLAHDKILTQLELQKKSIPMPKTYLASTTEAAKEILEKINYPIIMKFPKGTGGKGVMVADSFASASSMLDALKALNQPFLIQEYIDTNGVDIRALVAGDKVIAAMKRVAKEGETRANIHAGGKGEMFKLDDEAVKISIESAKIIGADICAIDILEGPKGPMVIEANTSPGLQGITDATKINVAEKIAKFLAEKTTKMLEKDKKNEASKILKEVEGELDEKEILINLDFRSNRMLLPDFVTKITGFNDKDEYRIMARKGKIVIEKF